LWDTGSTGTLISDKVVKELNLSIYRTGTAQYVDGTSHPSNTYICCLLIDNHTQLLRIEASNFKERPECDVIIGMDVIRYGKFLIEDENFSFVIKSLI